MKRWVCVLLMAGVTIAFGQTWYIETVDSGGAALNDVGQYTSLAIDDGNFPHITYYDVTNQLLKYATWNGDGWEIEYVDSTTPPGMIGEYTSLALSPANQEPQIGYYDADQGHLKWAVHKPAGWEYGIPDPSTNDVGRGLDIVIGTDDYPHFSYYDATAFYLMYARSLGGTWNRDTVDTVGNPADFCSSILLDGSGIPHIAYYVNEGGTGYLKYAHLVSGNWVIDTVELRAGEDVGLYPDLILASNGAPYISYFDRTNGYFKYARWANGQWNIDIIDNATNVGAWGNQVLGSTYVSYYDGVNMDVKYGYTSDYLSWHTESVDGPDDVGEYTSIALSKKGEINFPHISYYDATNGDLKYATKILKDVEPTVIVEPRDTVYFDTSYTPRVTIVNNGNAPVACDVNFEIKHGPSGILRYSQIYAMPSLGVNEETELTYSTDWTVGDSGCWYYITVETLLPDDSVPDNDLLLDSVWSKGGGAVSEDIISPVVYKLDVSGTNIELALPKTISGELYVLDVTGSRRFTIAEGDFKLGMH
ncbi:hypothetical protein GF359_03055, partial [candidate division WOR-3 bacterium]|nr:hypothetical protein [candidate division WOR-3 bacterium]MBD3364173.1 hypothetical protein [candidate division WOR-3 bacterium]